MKTMNKLTPLAAGLLLAFNVQAQDHTGHAMPAPQDHAQHQTKPPTTKKKTPAKPKPKAAKPKPKPAVDHAAMGHAMPPSPSAAHDHDAMQQQTTTSTPVDHAAMGHAMPETPSKAHDHGAMEHEASKPMPMDHAAMGHTQSPAPDQPIEPIPVLTDADRAAAVPPAHGHLHGNSIHSYVAFNRLEGFDTDEGTGMGWEGTAWVGGDLNKLWLRTEGERVDGHTESADLEVLYGRAIAPWWDLVAGVRHDFKPGASQDFLAVGVQGLAPYKFEVAATAYLGQSGQTAATVEVEYETLLTNRLILQPVVEAEFHGKNDALRGIGSGLSTVEAGLRLRYEITRKFAPYIGVVHERAFGRTADFRREAGEGASETRFVAGVRLWF